MSKDEKKKLAKQLVRLYYAELYTKSYNLKHRGVRMTQHKKLSELSPSERKAFLKTAEIVLALEADPREFIVAQFQAFAEHSQRMSKYILPMPFQLHTLAAQVRYMTYKGNQEVREARKTSTAAKMVRGFYSEERRLSGLSRINRVPPEDILIEKCEEFSKDFLLSKGVWHLVEDRWQERTAN